MRTTIITAVYNNSKNIRQALESVLSQVGADVELVVVDGGSTDGSLGIIQQYSNRIAALISEPDKGIYDALNKGIARARGDVVGFLHSDDLFADQAVLSRVKKAFANPEVDAVYGDLVYVDKHDTRKVIRLWKAGEFTPERLGWGWMPPHPTFYVRKSVYERLGGFDLRYRIAADYDNMLRFLGPGGVRCAYIPEVLVKMRVGGASNRSLGNILRKSQEDYRALRANGIGGLGALLWKNISKVPQFFAAADDDEVQSDVGR